MNTDTPETDKATVPVYIPGYGRAVIVWPRDAQKLERERDAARAENQRLREALTKLLEQFASEIMSEYEGTGMLADRLSEADHAREALKPTKP